MTYKELKETEIYLGADVVEIYSAETGEELDDRIPEEELNSREVVEYRRTSGFLSIGVQGVQTRLKRNVRFESK